MTNISHRLPGVAASASPFMSNPLMSGNHTAITLNLPSGCAQDIEACVTAPVRLIINLTASEKALQQAEHLVAEKDLDMRRLQYERDLLEHQLKAGVQERENLRASVRSLAASLQQHKDALSLLHQRQLQQQTQLLMSAAAADNQQARSSCTDGRDTLQAPVPQFATEPGFAGSSYSAAGASASLRTAPVGAVGGAQPQTLVTAQPATELSLAAPFVIPVCSDGLPFPPAPISEEAQLLEKIMEETKQPDTAPAAHGSWEPHNLSCASNSIPAEMPSHSDCKFKERTSDALLAAGKEAPTPAAAPPTQQLPTASSSTESHIFMDATTEGSEEMDAFIMAPRLGSAVEQSPFYSFSHATSSHDTIADSTSFTALMPALQPQQQETSRLSNAAFEIIPTAARALSTSQQLHQISSFYHDRSGSQHGDSSHVGFPFPRSRTVSLAGVSSRQSSEHGTPGNPDEQAASYFLDQQGHPLSAPDTPGGQLSGSSATAAQSSRSAIIGIIPGSLQMSRMPSALPSSGITLIPTAVDASSLHFGSAVHDLDPLSRTHAAVPIQASRYKACHMSPAGTSPKMSGLLDVQPIATSQGLSRMDSIATTCSMFHDSWHSSRSQQLQQLQDTVKVLQTLESVATTMPQQEDLRFPGSAGIADTPVASPCQGATTANSYSCSYQTGAVSKASPELSSSTSPRLRTFELGGIVRAVDPRFGMMPTGHLDAVMSKLEEMSKLDQHLEDLEQERDRLHSQANQARNEAALREQRCKELEEQLVQLRHHGMQHIQELPPVIPATPDTAQFSNTVSNIAAAAYGGVATADTDVAQQNAGSQRMNDSQGGTVLADVPGMGAAAVAGDAVASRFEGAAGAADMGAQDPAWSQCDEAVGFDEAGAEVVGEMQLQAPRHKSMRTACREMLSDILGIGHGDEDQGDR